MGKNVNKKFTAILEISTDKAEEQVRASAEVIKKTLKEAMAEGINTKDLRNMARQINNLFSGIGKSAPIDIDKYFKGRGNAGERIKLLTDSLTDLFNVIERGDWKTNFGNSGKLTDVAQKEIDNLKTQVSDVENLKKEFSNIMKLVSQYNEGDVVDGIATTEKEALNLLDSFKTLHEYINNPNINKNSLEYFQKLSEYLKTAARLAGSFDDYGNGDADYNITNKERRLDFNKYGQIASDYLFDIEDDDLHKSLDTKLNGIIKGLNSKIQKIQFSPESFDMQAQSDDFKKAGASIEDATNKLQDFLTLSKELRLRPKFEIDEVIEFVAQLEHAKDELSELATQGLITKEQMESVIFAQKDAVGWMEHSLVQAHDDLESDLESEKQAWREQVSIADLYSAEAYKAEQRAEAAEAIAEQARQHAQDYADAFNRQADTVYNLEKENENLRSENAELRNEVEEAQSDVRVYDEAFQEAVTERDRLVAQLSDRDKIDVETKLNDFFALTDEIKNKSFDDPFTGTVDNVEIGKYTERLNVLKTELDALGEQGKITVEDLERINEAAYGAEYRLKNSETHYTGYGDYSYADTYYDEYKDEQRRADEAESELRRQEEGAARLLDEKFALQEENESLRDQLNKQKDVDSSTNATDIYSKEVEQLELLQQNLIQVKDAVDAKTQVFENESAVVDAVVDAEISKLNSLLDKLEEVKSKINLAKDEAIQKEASNLGSVEPNQSFSLSNAFKGMDLKGFIKNSVNKDAEKQLEEEFYKLAQTFIDEDAEAMYSQAQNIAEFIVNNSRTFRERKEENIYEDAFKALQMAYTEDDAAAMGPQLFERAKSILGRKLQKASDKNKHFDRIDQAMSTLAANYPSLFEDLDGNESHYNKLEQLLDTFDAWKREGNRKTRDVSLDENDVQGIVDYIYSEMLAPMMANIDEQRVSMNTKNGMDQISIGDFPDAQKNTTASQSSLVDEIAQLENLRKKLSAVKKAVTEKTEAFKEEGAVVDTVIGGELQSLHLLWESLDLVAKQIDRIVTGISYINSQNVKVPNNDNEDIEELDTNKKQHIETQIDSTVKDYALDSTLQTTNSLLNEISGKLNQEHDFSDLINPLKGVVNELQNAANGIVQHQKAQNNNAAKEKTKAVQDKFKADLDSQLDAFDKYEKNLEGAGYLTTELTNKIEELEAKLVSIGNAADLTAWQKEFEELGYEIDVAKAKWTGQHNDSAKKYNKQIEDAFKGLGFSDVDSDLSAEQQEVVQAYHKAKEAVAEYKQNVKEGNQVEASGINATIEALERKVKAYKVNNNIADVSAKNFGATAVRREATRAHKMQSLASNPYSGYSSSDKFMDKYHKYAVAYDKLIDKQKEFAGLDSLTNEQVAEWDRLKNACIQAGKELERLYNASEKLKNNSGHHKLLGDDFENDDAGRKRALTDYVKSLIDADVESIKFKNDYTKCVAVVKESGGTFKQVSATIDTFGNQMVANVDDLGKSTSTLGNIWDEFKRKVSSIGTYLMAMFGFEELIQQFRQGISYVREIDAALTDLKKVTSGTEEEYNSFLQSMSKTSSVVGSTVADLTTMSAEWARLGYSMKEAGELAESTAILLNVSEFEDATQASEALISTMQAFSYTADESQHVVDVLNEVGNNYAVSSDGIATALQDSASALMEAGNNLEQSVALIAAAMKNWLFI